ncbi:MAG: single-stranded DNA-binding protein [Patescibacteria group bacterium]|jgi:single-strand DNA-binding protein
MASRSLNRIVLIGNLTRDPELKYTPAGTAVCTFSIATNRSWTTNDGQTKEEVQYHRVVAWQKLAELCGKLLNKGRKVFAEGRMTYRTFTGKDGVLRTIAEIVLDDFIVFGEGRKMTEGVETDKKVETGTVSENVPAKADETKSEAPKEETVNPDDIPF